MLTVWKYSVPAEDYFDLWLPVGAKPLTVQTQHGEPKMWVLLDENEAVHSSRRFRIAGTGHPIQELIETLQYVGSFQLYGGTLIFHVFEAFVYKTSVRSLE